MAVKDTLLAVSGLLSGNSGGGGSTLITKTITENGTYAASSDNADGFSSVTVDVPGLDLSAVNKVNFGINGATITSDNVVFDLSGKTVVLATLPFRATATIDPTTVTIKCKDFSAALPNIAQGASHIRTLVLDTEQDAIPLDSQSFYSTGFYHVLGTPLLSKDGLGAGNYRCFNSSTLVEFYLTPNGCGASVKFTTGELIDATVVSCANCLKAATGQTITFSNAVTKAKCSTIVGTVSTVGEGDDAYDFFTQDQDNGTVTLAEFITNTKGWTLA